MSEVIASDFDGTWTDFPELWGITDVIVTGRSWELYSDLKDLKDGPDIPIFMNPVDDKENDKMKIVTHKANIINKTKAKKFYEDMPDEVAMLKILCPNTKIILAEKGKTLI